MVYKEGDLSEPAFERYDRDTALAVLKDLSRYMYPSNFIFGCKTLVITRKAFEAVRKKYLDSDKPKGEKDDNRTDI